MHAARGRRGDRRRFAFAVIFGLAGSCHNRRRSSLRIYQHVLAEKISALRKSVAGSPTLEKATEAVKGLERELANPTPEPKVGTEPSPPEQAEEGRKRTLRTLARLDLNELSHELRRAAGLDNVSSTLKLMKNE
jgi:hypothetical protein